MGECTIILMVADVLQPELSGAFFMRKESTGGNEFREKNMIQGEVVKMNRLGESNDMNSEKKDEKEKKDKKDMDEKEKKAMDEKEKKDMDEKNKKEEKDEKDEKEKKE